MKIGLELKRFDNLLFFFLIFFGINYLLDGSKSTYGLDKIYAYVISTNLEMATRSRG